MPVLLATTMAMPDSKNGVVKSTTVSRSALIFRAERTKSVLLLTNSHIRPFQDPCYVNKVKYVSFDRVLKLDSLLQRYPILDPVHALNRR